MNPLLSVLEPSPALQIVHARLAAQLNCSTHYLLNAKADVFEPGEEGAPPPVKARPSRPFRSLVYDDVQALLSHEPITYAQIAKAVPRGAATLKDIVSHLLRVGVAKNLSVRGQVGRYVLASAGHRPAEPERPLVGHKATVFAHMTDAPITLARIMHLTGLDRKHAESGLSMLLRSGRVRNLAPGKKPGQYVRTAPMARGVFDV